MRFLFAILFIVPFLLIGILYLGVEWLITKLFPRCRYKSDLRTLRLVQWAFKVILWIAGTKVIVKGEENVPKDEPVLYIGNHRSIFDIIITYSRCPGLTGYISKAVIRKIPILRLFMKRLHCQFMVREDIKQSFRVILDAIESIKAGISICIFPEGTRCKDPDPNAILPFKEGSFKIAQKTGCKIIPFAVKGTNEIFEDHVPWIKKKTVYLTYGAPVIIGELSKEEQKSLGSYCNRIVADMLKAQN